MFFMNQGSVRLCGGKDGTSSAGSWDVSGRYLFCGGFCLLTRACAMTDLT